jgi:hypothetical protein
MDEPSKESASREFYQQNKVVLVLQDSNAADSGIVYDVKGYVPVDISRLNECQAIGYWRKGGDKLIKLELCTTIEAQKDLMVNFLVEIRKSRIEQYGDALIPAIYPHGVDTSGVGEHKRVVRVNKPTESAESEKKIAAEFSSLKDKLMRRKA